LNTKSLIADTQSLHNLNSDMISYTVSWYGMSVDDSKKA